MQPPLIVPEEVVSGLPPRWVAVALWVGVAVALTFLAARGVSAPPLRRWQPLFHVASVGAWAVAGGLIGLRFLTTPTPSEMVARGLLLLLVTLVALPILRDLFSGLALAVEGRHRIGDDVRIGPREGRIISFGLRSVVLRDIDGTETTLPNRRFAAAQIVRLNLARQDAPCQFEVAVPSDHDLEDVTKRLLEAAMLSPYAAPGRRPEVFAVADEQGRLRVRVRAFVFDRAYEERYRGDVLARADMVGRAAS